MLSSILKKVLLLKQTFIRLSDLKKGLKLGLSFRPTKRPLLFFESTMFAYRANARCEHSKPMNAKRRMRSMQMSNLLLRLVTWIVNWNRWGVNFLRVERVLLVGDCRLQLVPMEEGCNDSDTSMMLMYTSKKRFKLRKI